MQKLDIHLRDYQLGAIDATRAWFRSHQGSPVIVHPTGSGKSVTIAGLCQMAVDAGSRVLVLTHVGELVEQLGEKLKSMLEPELVGIYSAGLGSRDTEEPVVVAQVQSAFRKPEAFGHRDLVVVDEAQMVPLTGTGMYRSLLGSLRDGSPGLKLIGFSATPYRLDSGLIYGEGEQYLFTGVSHEVSVSELIRERLLCPLVNRAGSRNARPDLRGVAMRGGDFVPAQLGEAATAGNIVELAVADALPKLESRCSVLWFCCTVAHAEQVADALRGRSENAAVIHGDTPSRDRVRIVEEFKAGDLRHLVNCQCLTVGFDAPGIDGIVMLRPTASPGLYAQMAGRGLRIAPSKEDTLLLDFAGNIARHGPIDQIRPRRKLREDRETRCGCGEEYASHLGACPFCGKEPVGQAGRTICHGIQSDEESEPLFAAIRRPVRVRSVAYAYHSPKSGKEPSLRVTYRTDCPTAPSVSEWVRLQTFYPAWQRKVAADWWRARSVLPVPRSVDEAVRIARTGCLLEPTGIVLEFRANELYPKVRGYEWEE